MRIMATKYPELWAKYNAALTILGKTGASKTSNGEEKNYGIAAERLMRVGEMYKIKAKYRGK